MSYKGLRVNGVHSWDDLGARMLSRSIEAPAKRSAYVDDVPFMDGFYDYSEAYGRVFWGSREAVYVFRVLGSAQAEQAHAVLTWLCGISGDEIYDEFEEGRHLIGSLKDAPAIDEHISRHFTDITATFLCQPYWFADEETTVNLSTSTSGNIVVNNGQPVYPTATNVTNTATKITIGGITESAVNGEELALELPSGQSVVYVTGSACTITYHEASL